MDRHLTDDELTLHYYGELEAGEERAAAAHLAACADCRGQLAALQRVMAAIDTDRVDDPGPDFETAVWRRLEPSLATPAPRRAVRTPLSWQWLAAAAVLILAAFVAGRYSIGTGQAPAPTAGTVAVDRVLLVDLGGHLDLAEMTLAEFGSMPVIDEMVRARTEDLIAANRLYRGTALNTGDEAVARVLDELERALIEIATAPSDATDFEIEDLRQRIDSGGLVLKLRVMRDVLQDRAPRVGATENSTL